MRIGAIAAFVLTCSSIAHAGWLEVGGFFGADKLPNDVKLGGNTTDPEQRPQTGPELGGRIGWIAVPIEHLELGVEAELALTPTWTGYGFSSGRESDFAPVIGYRGALVARLADYAWIKPHVLVGAGGASVVSGSPFLHDTSDPQLFYGIGASVDVTRDLQLRIDARQGWLPTEGGEGATYELMLGIGTSFGRPAPSPPPEPEHSIPTVPIATTLEPEPEPEPTPVVVAPDPNADDDGDGIPNGVDKCPTAAETFNGWQDADGCPDDVPPAIASALAAATAVRFDGKHVKLGDANEAALGPALDALRTHREIHIDIVAHAGADDPSAELATKRADAVKWHFVEQGVPADRFTVVVGPPQADASAPAIELQLHPASH
ncbi:MAG TPA: OmpA family protein [Kofleriaceae bacterium]